MSGESFRVIALVPSKGSDLYLGCKMIPADAIYPEIYSSVFGPAPEQECREFMRKRCGRAELKAEELGEGVPYPWQPGEWPWLPPGRPGARADHMLGKATYLAVRRGGVVTLAAGGVLRYSSDRAMLLQMPILVWPPQFQLVFESGEIGLPSIGFFQVTASLADPETKISALVVHDEDGRHVVPVT